MAQIQEELVLFDKFSGTFTRYIRLGEQASGATRKAQNSVDQFTQSQKMASEASSDLANGLKNLVGAYAGLQGIKALFNLSDSITSTTARLDMMNDGLQTTDELTQMIYQSAQKTGSSYLETADAVAKMGTLAGDAFSSSEEIVAFMDQINKQMAISGTGAMQQQAAMLQLTQGLSSGALRGEELNSILENTPMIAQTIADYLNMTTGEMREFASEGGLTADVIKNAMFSAAEETNAAFEQIPMTWGRVWNTFKNAATMALQPVLNGISWLANHMDTLKPILFGVAAGAIALAAGLGIQAAATWIANGAAKVFFTTLLTNPLTYIVLVIGLVVAAIYKWVQSMGGLQIAWLVVVDNVLYAWDTLKAGFFTGVYWVMDLFDNLGLKIQTVSTNIQNFIGDMRVGVLSILQSMVNGAIDIINWFIEKINQIPGVSIDAIEKVTFGTTAALENEAAKADRNADLAAYRQEVEQNIQNRADELEQMWAERDANRAARQAEIEEKRAAQSSGDGNAAIGAVTSSDEIAGQLGDISKDVGAIKKEVSMSQEDLKSLVDVAERRYVNKINLTAQTPVIHVNGQNTGNTEEDRRRLADAIKTVLIEQAASASLRTTARAF